MSDAFGRVSLVGEGCVVCVLNPGLAVAPGATCILQASYGLEHAHFKGMGAAPAAGDDSKLPRIARLATDSDDAQARANAEQAEKALGSFTRLLDASGIAIKPLAARFALNRERLLIVFGASEHIDCRKAVGKLQWDLKTRVEVRHVGVRDEAAVAGGMGPCGRALCCATWMRNFRSVNVRMAKTQEMSLNPVAINGCCGRLKCCLRYEYDVYLEAGEGLPSDGEIVRWQDGEGIVAGRDVLRGRLNVRTRDRGLQHVAASDATVVHADAGPAPARKEETHDDPDREWPESGPARKA